MVRNHVLRYYHVHRRRSKSS